MSEPHHGGRSSLERDAPRAMALRFAAAETDELASRAEASGRWMLVRNPFGLPLPRIARNLIAVRFADRWAGDDGGLPVLTKRRLALLVARAASDLRSRLGALSPPKAELRLGAGSSRLCVLLVAREPCHFHQLVPVVEKLREKVVELEPWWVLFSRHHKTAIPPSAGKTVEAEEFRPSARELAFLRREITEMSSRDISEPCSGLRSQGNAYTLFAEVARQVMAEVASHALTVTRAIADVMERTGPSVIVAGNPCTMEGRIAVELARCSGVPSLAVQHGSMFSEDPLWRDIPVSLFCTWGSQARDAWISYGYRRETAAVTGDPGGDLKPAQGWGASLPTGKVVVALSGSGHQTGRNEQRHLVSVIASAAAIDRGGRWLVRVHPKDNPESYLREISEVGARNVEVVSARVATTTLREELLDALCLVTSTSASAADAILMGVPVVSLSRPAGECVPDYVTAGATLHVEATPEALARAVAKLRMVGPPAEVVESAVGFRERFFGVLDGCAAVRVAEELLGLAAATKSQSAPRPSTHSRGCGLRAPQHGIA